MPNIKDLEGYIVQRSLGGGTQSTYELSKPGLPSLVLKYGTSQEAISFEILCNRLYAALGVKVPLSTILYNIPSPLAKQLNISEDSLVQISEYIEPAAQQDIETIQQEARAHFAVHALLGNLDVPKADNFIQAQDNQIYLIDAGSHFILRALGEKRIDNIHEVTEIESLRTYSQTNQEWFGSMSESQIKEQVKYLLKNEFKIEPLIWELSNILKLSDEIRYAFLDALSDRFDYLALHYAPTFPRYSKPDRKANPKNLAVSVFLYAIHQNEPMVLLAKHPSLESWDFLGGEVQTEDRFLHISAARIVREQSKASFDIYPATLQNSSFQEAITYKEGKPFIHRLYFQEVSYNHANESGLKWIRLSQWQEQNQNQLWNEESIQQMILYLNQHKSLKGMTLPVRHRRFPSPMEIHQQYTRTIFNHLTVMAQMKMTEKNTVASVKSSWMTQTELYMKSVLGDKYQEDMLLENTREMLKLSLKVVRTPIDSDEFQCLLNQCVKFINNEKNASRNTVFLYHGCDSAIAFAYEMYSVIHQIFQANPGHNAFRGNHHYFEPFKNIAEFESAYTDKFGNIDNNKKDYHEVAISTNFSLFGSHDDAPSNSIAYFLDNTISRSVNLKSLLRSVLPEGISDLYLQTLLNLYQLTYPKNKGVLYQIAISADIADKYAYLAQAGGSKLLYKRKGTPGTILALLSEDFKTEPENVNDYLRELQIRFMVPPHLNLKVATITEHDLQDHDSFEPKMRVTEVIAQALARDILLHAPDNYFQENTPASILLRHFKEQNIMPQMTSSHNEFTRSLIDTAIESDQWDSIVDQIRHSPEMADYALSRLILTNRYDICHQIIADHPEFKTDKLKPYGMYKKEYISSDQKNYSVDYLITLIKDASVKAANQEDHFIGMMIACFGLDWKKYPLPTNFSHNQITKRAWKSHKEPASIQQPWLLSLYSDLIKEIEALDPKNRFDYLLTHDFFIGNFKTLTKILGLLAPDERVKYLLKIDILTADQQDDYSQEIIGCIKLYPEFAEYVLVKSFDAENYNMIDTIIKLYPKLLNQKIKPLEMYHPNQTKVYHPDTILSLIKEKNKYLPTDRDIEHFILIMITCFGLSWKSRALPDNFVHNALTEQAWAHNGRLSKPTLLLNKLQNALVTDLQSMQADKRLSYLLDNNMFFSSPSTILSTLTLLDPQERIQCILQLNIITQSSDVIVKIAQLIDPANVQQYLQYLADHSRKNDHSNNKNLERFYNFIQKISNIDTAGAAPFNHSTFMILLLTIPIDERSAKLNNMIKSLKYIYNHESSAIDLLNLLKLLPENERLLVYKKIQEHILPKLFDIVGLLKILPAEDIECVFSEYASIIISELQEIGKGGTLEVLIDLLPLPLIKHVLDSLKKDECNFIYWLSNFHYKSNLKIAFLLKEELSVILGSTVQIDPDLYILYQYFSRPKENRCPSTLAPVRERLEYLFPKQSSDKLLFSTNRSLTFTSQEIALSDEAFIDCLNEKLIKLNEMKEMTISEKLNQAHKILTCIEQLTDQIMIKYAPKISS